VTSLIDPELFLVDPQIKSFIHDERHDLLAPDAPIVGTGRFVIVSLKAPRGQVIVVKSLVPHAYARTDMGTANESFEMLDPMAANGFFSFEPLVNDSSPFVIELDYNAPSIEGGTLLDSDRQRTKGISHISSSPWADVQRSWFNPMFSILIKGDSTFTVVFSILPPPVVATPLPFGGQYSIEVGAAKRVDFVGCMLGCMQMSEQYYHFLETERAKGHGHGQ